MARAPPLRDVGRRADEIASWRRRTATARLRDLSSLRTGIFAAGMLSATPVDLRLSRLRGAGFRLRLNARDPREIASLISERPCSSPRCDRRNSRSRSRSAVSTSSWVAGILSICRHLNRQPNSRHRPVASFKIWLTGAFWPSESPPDCQPRTKTTPRAEKPPRRRSCPRRRRLLSLVRRRPHQQHLQTQVLRPLGVVASAAFLSHKRMRVRRPSVCRDQGVSSPSLVQFGNGDWRAVLSVQLAGVGK